jgi:uncharacterized protein
MKTIFLIFLITAINSPMVFAQDIYNAARENNLSDLQEYIKSKKDLNVPDERGYTPLILAVYNGSFDAARVLIENGADVNASDPNGNTALMAAAFKGDSKMLTLMIGAHAAVNQVNLNGATALIFAATFGRVEIVKRLISAGTDPDVRDNRNNSAYDHAKIQDHAEIIALLDESRLKKQKVD